MSADIKVVRLQWKMECCAAEKSKRIVRQVESTVNEIEDGILHNLRVGGCRRCVRRMGWRRFFWLVQLRRGEQANLITGVERGNAGALILWFVVVRGAGVLVNGRGRVGAASVKGVEVFAAAVAIRGGVVEGASGIDEVGGVDGLVVAAAVVVGGVGVDVAGADGIDDAGGMVEVAAAVAVVECVDVEDAVAAAAFDGGVGVGVGDAGIVAEIAAVGVGGVSGAGDASGVVRCVGVAAAGVAIGGIGIVCTDGGDEACLVIDAAGDIVEGAGGAGDAIGAAGAAVSGGAEGEGSVDDAGGAAVEVAAACVGAIVPGMRILWGAGDVRGGGSGTVEVEGVRWMLTRRRALCSVDVCRVMKKNGGKVVGRMR